jgi:hypothetical protein
MGHDPLRSKQCFGWDHVASWSEGRTRETRERGYDKFKCLAARGPGSLEANSLHELRRERAQDKQVFADRLGDFIVIGPEPTARDKVVFIVGERSDQAFEGIEAELGASGTGQGATSPVIELDARDGACPRGRVGVQARAGAPSDQSGAVASVCEILDQLGCTFPKWASITA